jgi:hypothetical protein
MPVSGSHPSLRRILTQGRAHGLSVWVGSQLGNRLDTIVIRLADHCISFWVSPQDVALLTQARGVDAAPIGELSKFWWGYTELAGDPGGSSAPSPDDAR